MAACCDLHAGHLRDVCDLLLVTTEPVPPLRPGVRVVDDLRGRAATGWEVLAGADVMCFPSTIDQAPNAVLEAAAMGFPVVAHPVGAVPEMVLHGSTGPAVAPHDDAALLDALRTLLRDGALRRRLGAQARRHVEQHFDTTRLVRAAPGPPAPRGGGAAGDRAVSASASPSRVAVVTRSADLQALRPEWDSLVDTAGAGFAARPSYGLSWWPAPATRRR